MRRQWRGRYHPPTRLSSSSLTSIPQSVVDIINLGGILQGTHPLAPVMSSLSSSPGMSPMHKVFEELSWLTLTVDGASIILSTGIGEGGHCSLPIKNTCKVTYELYSSVSYYIHLSKNSQHLSNPHMHFVLAFLFSQLYLKVNSSPLALSLIAKKAHPRQTTDIPLY